MSVPSPRPGEHPPEEGEPRFERVTFTPEQRRLVRFIVILAAVALVWATVSIIVVTH